jgi:hypothetical protein
MRSKHGNPESPFSNNIHSIEGMGNKGDTRETLMGDTHRRYF